MKKNNDFEHNFNDIYYKKYGTWSIPFDTSIAFVSKSANIDPTQMSNEEILADKPFYLAVMARRNQLQPILDNPHLFDPAFVNAVRLLVIAYEDTTYEYSPS